MNSKKCFVVIVCLVICLIGCGWLTALLMHKLNNQKSEVKSENVSNVSFEQFYRYFKNEDLKNEMLYKNETLTELQKGEVQNKQEEFYKKNYKGKWIQWTGKIANVDYSIREHTYRISFAYIFDIGGNVTSRSDSGIFDTIIGDVDYNSDLFRKGREIEGLLVVRVKFPISQRERLLSLNKGALVTYQGKLPSSYLIEASDHHIEIEVSDHWIESSTIFTVELSLEDGRIISVKP